ncbi:MAG: proton-conducting transporter membrane subunit [Candidatus Bipolaricaulaceae bacterium]
MWEERRREGAFHPLVTLLVGTTLALVLSRDLFNLYVCLELTSLLSFLLVGYQARTQAVWASVQYLILTTVGLILYLFGVGLVYPGWARLPCPRSPSGRVCSVIPAWRWAQGC